MNLCASVLTSPGALPQKCSLPAGHNGAHRNHVSAPRPTSRTFRSWNDADADTPLCTATDASPISTGIANRCVLLAGHPGQHSDRTDHSPDANCWSSEPPFVTYATDIPSARVEREHCADTYNGIFARGTVVCELSPGHAGQHRDGDDRWSASQCDSRFHTQLSGRIYECVRNAGHEGAHNSLEFTWPDEHAYRLPDGVRQNVETHDRITTVTTVTHSLVETSETHH